MKSNLILIGLALALAPSARADFNPVALTPGSYTFDIVVESNTVPALPYVITSTAGNGTGLGDNTYYEQGLVARAGQSGGNSGIPIHNTTFTNINDATVQFLMPPDYSTNNDLMIDSTFTSGTFTFNAATTATDLAILGTGGGGTVTVNYTVTHSDTSTESGTINLLDWFTGGSTVAWGANGRIDVNGNYNNYNSSSVNNNPPYLYANHITVSGASPITSITFNYSSGQHANFYAVSGNGSGSSWTPIAVSGFNQLSTVPAAFPLTATMDQGTNTAYNGNLATWFEQGFIRTNLSYGLPRSGSIFNSSTQPTHHYQMGNYSTNNAILIDANHLSANITPASPAAYNAFSFLTAGGDIGGGNRMTNTCIMQHQDGVNETNTFYGYDWFEGSVPGFVAYVSNGRVNMANRTVNALGSGNPKLFETYFTLSDTASPVTNIVLKLGSTPNASATTFIMAVSATAGGVPPVILNPPQRLNTYPGSTAQFSVTLGAGTTPVYSWQKGPSATGAFTNLSNGGNVSGSTTATLSLANVSASDAGYYQVIITNSVGAATSSPVALYLLSSTLANIDLPADPISDSSFANNIPSNTGEGVSNVVDRTTSKYLCYGSGPTNGQAPFQGPVGYVVTPANGNAIVSAMRIYTANDHPERDPADCKLEGSNDGGSTWATILADTPLSLPDARNDTGLPLNATNQVLQELDFANSTGYTTYRVTFNNVKTNATAIGLQVAEIELLGISSNAPIISPDLAATNYALAGGTATFTVGVLGTAPFTNRWTYNNNPLTDGGRISGAHTTTLLIANVQASDAGTYQFWSTNGIGTTGSAVSTLVVKNVLGFNANGSGWKLNNRAGPPASFVGNNSLQLTTAGAGGQANSIFFHDPLYVRAFKAFFTYYDMNDGADGMCFVLQNAAAGINAVGAGGGGLGVRGITNSVEVELDLFTKDFAYDTNGLTHEAGDGFPAGNPEFQLLGTGDDVGAAGQTKDMTILYSGSVMTLTWSNETSQATGTTNLNVGDITHNVGGSTAYVGFTGACGGIDDTQIVGDFQFIPLPVLSIVPGGGGVVLTWPTGIGGYALQKNSSLSNPAGWTTIAGPYSVVSGQYQVTVSPATNTQFYRLVATP